MSSVSGGDPVPSADRAALYVHAADDGGILLIDRESGTSAWVSAAELSRRLEGLSAAGGLVLLSTTVPEGPRTAIALAVVETISAASVPVVRASEVHPDGIRPGGATSLMSAAYVGARELLNDLVRRGAGLEDRDISGYTALMYAAKADQVEAAELLLAAGARPNAADSRGSTPLMFAAQHGYLAVVRRLLDAGASVGARGDHGLTAYDFAVQNGHGRVAAVLLSAEQSVS